jgi:hypothetical protein
MVYIASLGALYKKNISQHTSASSVLEGANDFTMDA